MRASDITKPYGYLYQRSRRAYENDTKQMYVKNSRRHGICQVKKMIHKSNKIKPQRFFRSPHENI